MSTLQNDLILQAALGKQTMRRPVWLMRQAGRILPEYRAVRAQAGSFKNLVTNPELSAEVTIQPVDILGVDAAIIFSDILVVPQALGFDYEMVEKKGPIFNQTVQNPSDVQKAQVTDPRETIDYTLKAIELTKKGLDGRVPLIGFAGAPWTIFAYLIEGSGSKTFSKARRFLYEHPKASHELLEKITEITALYLSAQVESGADMLQIFDSWAGILPNDQYQEFGLRYIEQLCDRLNEVPLTVFSKGTVFALDKIAKFSCNTVGLDWNIDRAWAKQRLMGKTIQGNLDPCVLYADELTIKQKTDEMLKAFEGHAHIVNLGHGVYPDTDPGKVKFFIDYVKNYETL